MAETDPELENVPPSLTSSDNLSNKLDPRSPNKKLNLSTKSNKSRSKSTSSSPDQLQKFQPPNDPNACVNLALKGEKLCLDGDCQAGIRSFEAAIQVGTDDPTILSAIYSQIGNAHFYLQEYEAALQYHKYDFQLGQQINDHHKQATALGNLCNTFKCLEKFDQAVNCSVYELKIGHQLDDAAIQSRALYNLGNVYHARGKKVMSEQVGISCLLSNSYLRMDSQSAIIDDLTNHFEKAISYYEENLAMAKENFDTISEGRALGQLGNVNYRLGRWDTAVSYHEDRLDIAVKTTDIPGERRALANLANSHAGAGRLDLALKYYKKALELARRSKEQEAEAQACWSLAAAYQLLGDYDLAIMYQRNHLEIARALEDKIGEQKALYNLGPLYSKTGQEEQAAEVLKAARNMSFDTTGFELENANHHSTGIFENSTANNSQVSEDKSEGVLVPAHGWRMCFEKFAFMTILPRSSKFLFFYDFLKTRQK